MIRAEVVFPALLFAVVASLLAAGFFVFHHSWTVITFPFGAGAIVCALCLADIAMTLSGRRAGPGIADAPLEPLSPASLIWAFALAVFVYALGFVFGPAAYLLVYLRANGSSWRVSFGITVASLVVTWVVFVKLLRILLPIQPLWWSW